MKTVFNVGDKVNYHCFAGGKVTSSGHLVESISLQPNNFGDDVAWISGKSGCISMECLTEDKG